MGCDMASGQQGNPFRHSTHGRLAGGVFPYAAMYEDLARIVAMVRAVPEERRERGQASLDHTAQRGTRHG